MSFRCSNTPRRMVRQPWQEAKSGQQPPGHRSAPGSLTRGNESHMPFENFLPDAHLGQLGQGLSGIRAAKHWKEFTSPRADCGPI